MFILSVVRKINQKEIVYSKNKFAKRVMLMNHAWNNITVYTVKSGQHRMCFQMPRVSKSIPKVFQK